MDQPTCTGCLERDARIDQLQTELADLRAQVHELKSRLGLNASNSGIPPPANPPQAPPPVVEKPTGRKPGGQPGHPPHLRLRLPADRLTEPTRHYWPQRCRACALPLPKAQRSGDPEPRWHQVVELPEFPVEVTGHQAHGCTCSCGEVTWGQIPAATLQRVWGPRSTATFSFSSGVMHASKRRIEEFAETVLQAPIALGTISNLEREMSAALETAHAEAQKAVQEAAAKNVDETGWKQAGVERRLWGAATATAACFVIAPSRGWAGLAALLGEKIRGIVSGDRWSVYGRLKLGLRQLCWAHLKRDFQKPVDRGGVGQVYGAKGLAVVQKLFDEGRLFRGGGGTRAKMQAVMQLLRVEVRGWLREGARCGDAEAAASCGNLLDLEPATWKFVRHSEQGVEPTDNQIERQLRPGVLWRKNAFGCHSEGGCRFVERMLTVVQTLRPQKRPVMQFLTESLAAHRGGSLGPKLILGR